MWIYFAFLAALTAALVAIFGKIGLQKVDPTLATTLRAILMAGFLVLVSLLSGKFRGFSLDNLNGREWLMVLLAAVAGALSWLFYFLALKDGDASRVSAIDRLSLVFVVFLAAIFLGESLSTRAVAGAFMVAVGAVLIVMK
jgi:transporter family protein